MSNKLTLGMQFSLIFISFFGIIVGGAFLFGGFISFNIIYIFLGIILSFMGVGSAIRLFSEL